MGGRWPVGQELRKHLNEVVIPANAKLGKRQIPEGCESASSQLKAGSQATSARRSSTPCVLGDKHRDPGSQGQHHEVHGGAFRDQL